jgi:hypothetical protein
MPATRTALARTAPARSVLTRVTATLLGAAALLALPAAAAAHGMGLPPVQPSGPIGYTRPATHLTVSYDDGSGRHRAYTLTCGDSRLFGTDSQDDRDSRDANACRRLDEIGGPVTAVPEGQVCSMIYGGPQTAELSGTWQGRPVTESYRRTNGCEVARWNRMVPALPNPTAIETHGPIAG